MKVSKIGLKSARIKDLDKQFPVQEMLLLTGQLEQFASGIFAYGHVPYLVKKRIDEIIVKTLTKYGCGEVSLPLLQPESIWEKSGRLARYVEEDAMFRTTSKNVNYCLAPTAEEAIVEYAKSRLLTYKQLPTTYFQIGPKFRSELRNRGYLLRGKAFDMMDAYSFGRNKADLDVEYDNMKKAYIEIFKQLDMDVQPVGADSGAIGGAKSEEFMFVSDIGEDNILFDESTGKAFNSELMEKENYQQYLLENYGITNTSSLVTKKAVELGHIFQLGDKYSVSMDATFVNQNGAQEHYVMGCYGIGVSRTLAMLYENSGVFKDGNLVGIALPENVAPYKLHIIPKLDDEGKKQFAENLYGTLQQQGIDVLFDDRNDISIGAKIKDAKFVGCPYMVVLGNSINDGFVELENNKTGEKTKVAVDDFANYCIKLFKK